ncbi:helix-turn-helix domain-containing protein [Paenibacillus sp. GCM10027626]|uniref:helix-turn-helix domain-containing protein n=1 Tax=Paenibacillus sp. GCM10027626 TaxID=3273411 RepID=UPI003636678F
MLEIRNIVYDDMIENWRFLAEPAPHNILIYIVHGKVVYQLNGTDVILSKGDVLFVQAGTLRAAHNDKSGAHQKYAAHFDFTANIPLSKLAIPAEGFLKMKLRNTGYFRQRFSILLLQWYDTYSKQSFICDGILLELLGIAFRKTDNEKISAQAEELILKIKDYIFHNYTKPLRLTDLAQFAGKSPNHISKVFKQVLGQTPIEYINEIKIAIAEDLLTKTTMTVTQISDHLGYCEQSYFHRIFKKHTGKSPSYYRKEVKQS